MDLNIFKDCIDYNILRGVPINSSMVFKCPLCETWVYWLWLCRLIACMTAPVYFDCSLFTSYPRKLAVSLQYVWPCKVLMQIL